MRWIVGVFFFFASFSVQSQALRIITVVEPPASYLDSHGQLTGFSVEVVQAIQRSLNDKTKIEVMPEARAIHIARTQPNVLLFSFSKTEQREQEFYWIGQLVVKSWSAYALSSNSVQIKTLDQLRKVKAIGVVRGDIREEWLLEQDFNNLHPSVNHQQNIQRLRSGRLDLIAYESQGIQHLLWEEGLNADDIKAVYTLRTSEVYLLMSKSGTDPKLMQSWTLAAEKFRKNGQQQFIAEKWQLILKQYHNINTEARDGILYFE
ncbi:periplasmic component of amino acid ABC-type transporter/signal transduction system [Rheinheimera sp. A13L]|uniref:substrate-binding periplasmic protein n=1 Tax=Rheinheimera sp. A13L TaxID=506534 RepID=UPI0002124841|nr:transporter substrate-binding domain-containing protein [Rheinheimera sp. A13L]EGM78951.1 periplasmic component of amino acid ABC-type transporter/signal transduction system [Rheinheimera sp. A13L]